MVCAFLSFREYYFRLPLASTEPSSSNTHSLNVMPAVDMAASIRAIETKLEKIPTSDSVSDLVKGIQDKLNKMPSGDMTSIESKLDSHAKTLSELSSKLEKMDGQITTVASTPPNAATVSKGCELADAYKQVYQELQRDYCLHDYVDGGNPIVQQDFQPASYDGIQGDGTLKLFVYKDTSRDVVSWKQGKTICMASVCSQPSCHFLQISKFVTNGRWERDFLDHMLLAAKRVSELKKVPLSELFFLDIGTNLGSFSLFMASAGMQVISFEPSPLNLPPLRSSICANQMTNNITLFTLATGSKRQTCDIWSHHTNTGKC